MASAASYKYIVSLPERVLRSLGALSGGLLHEIGEVALPAAIRRTTLYRTMVGATLRFLIEQVGQVEGVYPAEGGLSENFIVRRAASHGIELLGILAFRASPIWVLAALADVTGSGHRLLREIAEALEAEGLLEPGSRFETMEQILGGLERTSAHLATTLNMPPVNVHALRREWDKLAVELQSIPPNRIPAIGLLERTWDDIRATAQTQNRTVFTVSSLLAISTLAHVPANLLWLSKAAGSAARRTTEVLGSAILDHYADALGEISREGLLGYWQREFRPYLRAAAEQFSPERCSLTEKLLCFPHFQRPRKFRKKSPRI
ncbi:MAG TPA: hypothetical protein VKB79_11025 [Bryobacteraceae bacterium]|nr:hypothetical protein [Bryobacteraceae bacterium]